MAAQAVRDHHPPGDHDDVEASATIAGSSPAVATFAAGDDNEDLQGAPNLQNQMQDKGTTGEDPHQHQPAGDATPAIVAAGSSPAVATSLE